MSGVLNEEDHIDDQIPSDCYLQEGFHEEERIIDEEPRFKYNRVFNDISQLFEREIPTAMTVADKFIGIATSKGFIVLFDFNGDSHREIPTRKHKTPVISLSFDDNCNYLASLSTDGMVSVLGIGLDDFNMFQQVIPVPRCIILSKDYGIRGSGQKMIVAGRELKILKRRLIRISEEKLYAGLDKDGFISALSWRKSLIAFSNISGTRIWDLKQNAIVSWIQPGMNLERCPLSRYPPNHCWISDNELAIGWLSKLTVVKIEMQEIAKGISAYTNAGITKNWTLNNSMLVAGLNYVSEGDDKGEFLIFGIKKEDKDVLDGSNVGDQAIKSSWLLGNDSRSVISFGGQTIVNGVQGIVGQICLTLIRGDDRDSYEVSSEDTIDMNNAFPSQLYKFKLFSIPFENDFYLLGDRALFKAKTIPVKERLDYKINHGMFDTAFEFAKEHESRLDAMDVKYVGRLLMEELFKTQQFVKAVKYIPAVCGTDKAEWEYMIREFETEKQLSRIANIVPTNNPRLDTEYYQRILETTLCTNVKVFRKLIMSWDPEVYDNGKISRTVMARMKSIKIENDLKEQSNKKQGEHDKNDIFVDLIQCLAKIRSDQKNFVEVVKIYLLIGDKAIFKIIEQNHLFSEVKEQLNDLMRIDSSETIKLIRKNEDQVATKDVLEQIKKQPLFLIDYLLKSFAKNKAMTYGDQAVKMIAKYKNNALMGFFKRYDNYTLDKAIEVCKKYNLIEELIFLLARSGANGRKEALGYIINTLHNINKALDFCKDHINDNNLIPLLIDLSVGNAKYVKVILEAAGSMIDLADIIDKIPDDMLIEELGSSIIKLINTCDMEVDNLRLCNHAILDEFSDVYDQILDDSYNYIKFNDNSKCIECQLNAVGSTSEWNAFYCQHMYHEVCYNENYEESGIIRPRSITVASNANPIDEAEELLNHYRCIKCHDTDKPYKDAKVIYS